MPARALFLAPLHRDRGQLADFSLTQVQEHRFLAHIRCAGDFDCRFLLTPNLPFQEYRVCDMAIVGIDRNLIQPVP
jgi:hypothetical protein